MPRNDPLDALPLWGLFMAILLLILLAIEGGYRLGQYRRSRSEQEKEAPVGAMVGATLGLLAFMPDFSVAAVDDLGHCRAVTAPYLDDI
jgi:hypothetical protein